MRKIHWIAWMGAVIGSVLAGKAAETVDELVELPTVTINEVREEFPPEKWLYAAVPGFEVLSSLSERETQRVLRDFARLRQAVDAAMPGLQSDVAGANGVLVLCGRNGDFARFLPPALASERFRLNHQMLPLGDGFAIVVDHLASRIDIDGAPLSGVSPLGAPTTGGGDGSEADFGGETTAGLEVEPLRAVYTSYFRQLIRRRGGSTAPWFEEGLVRLLGAIDYNARTVTVGRIGDGFGGQSPDDFREVLNARGLMPMSDFFSHTPHGADVIWSAQAYAFVHMCLYGSGKRHQAGFAQLVEEAMRRPVTDDVLRRTLGMDGKALGRELRTYLDFANYRYERFKATQGHSLPEPEPAQVRTATDAESGRLVGLVLIAADQRETGRRVMLGPVRRGQTDARLLGTLGVVEVAAGDRVQGKSWLAAAVAQGVDQSEPYLALARLQWAELDAGERRTKRPLVELAPTIAVLESAIRQAPARAEVFAELAAMWLRCADAPPPGAVGVVNAGVMQFPQNELLLVRAALLNARHGDPDEARELVDYGLRTVRDPLALATFRALQTQSVEVVAP
jgi:hypothetical protein